MRGVYPEARSSCGIVAPALFWSAVCYPGFRLSALQMPFCPRPDLEREPHLSSHRTPTADVKQCPRIFFKIKKAVPPFGTAYMLAGIGAPHGIYWPVMRYSTVVSAGKFDPSCDHQTTCNLQPAGTMYKLSLVNSTNS